MPNIQWPGFTPVRPYSGGSISYTRRRVLSANTDAINLGDALVRDSGGDTILATTTNTAVDSVACGVSYVDADGVRRGSKTLPASTTYSGTTVSPVNASYVFIPEDATNVLYRCSVDEAIAMTDLGLNYQMVLTAAANGFSKHELDATSRGTTATLPWRVIEFFDTPESDPDAADAHVVAIINAGMTEPALTTTGT